MQRESTCCALGTREGKAFGTKNGSSCREVGFIRLKEWQCNILN